MAAIKGWVLFVLVVSVCHAESIGRPLNMENVLINVTADTQLQESKNLQISFNVSVGEEQILVNDFPVEQSGVTRFPCQALILNSINGSREFESGDLVSTVTRVMVSQNRLYSDLEEVLALQLFSEVIELEGKEVQQPDMCEVKILMSPDFQKLGQFTNVYPIGHSDIFKFPRENDVVVTDPPSSSRDEEQLMTHTTSQYPHTEKQADTTLEEVAAPGKLPETPLRMDPLLLYNDGYDNMLDDRDQSRSDQNHSEVSSSYSAMCRWVEEMRERLHVFCFKSLPVFFLVMGVVVIGVVGSGFIVKILDVFFPACDHKHIFHLSPVVLMPEEEKQNLLEILEPEDEEKKP